MAQPSSPLLEKVYAHALRADVQASFALFQSVPVETLLPHESATIARYEQRFQSANVDLSDADEHPLAVQSLIEIYRGYWRRVLLKDVGFEEGQAQLGAQLQGWLGQVGLEHKTFDVLESAVIATLQKLGYHGLCGRTMPLRELMVWRVQHTQTFAVELVEGTEHLSVVLMRGFASRGWGHFATLGRYGAGGWASTDALYCIEDAYDDLDAEVFRINYLVHEAQHRADLRREPNMLGARLEYRAKLAELARVEHPLDHIRRFERHSGNDASKENNPHIWANTHVVRDMVAKLTGELGGECVWKAAAPEELRRWAAELLKEDN